MAQQQIKLNVNTILWVSFLYHSRCDIYRNIFIDHRIFLSNLSFLSVSHKCCLHRVCALRHVYLLTFLLFQFITKIFHWKTIETKKKKIVINISINQLMNIYPSFRFCDCAPERRTSSFSSWTCSSSLCASAIWLQRTLVIVLAGAAWQHNRKYVFQQPKRK